MWEPYKKGFKAWLQLEKSLSDRSVEAYLSDVDKLTQHLLYTDNAKNPGQLTTEELRGFLRWIARSEEHTSELQSQ